LTGCKFTRAVLFDNSFVNAILDDVDMNDTDVTRTDFKSGKVIYSIDYSPTLNSLVTDNSANKLVSIWVLSETNENPVNKKITLQGHTDDVFCVSLSPNGLRVASAGQDQSIRIWDTRTGSLAGVLRGHIGDIRNILFADDNTLISCSNDKQLIKWDLTRMISLDAISSDSELWGLSFDNEKNIIATGGLDGIITIWDFNDLSILQHFKLPEPQPRRHSIKLIPGQTFSISGCEDGTIFLWNYSDDSWKKIHKYDSPIKSLAVKSNGSLIATGLEDGRVVVWRGANLEYDRTIDAHINYVSSIVFDELQDRMFTTSPDGTIAAWNLSDYKLLFRLEEHFPNFQFSCKRLQLKNVTGLPKATLENLKKQGAVDE
jgi:WD40 repeat protein